MPQRGGILCSLRVTRSSCEGPSRLTTPSPPRRSSSPSRETYSATPPRDGWRKALVSIRCRARRTAQRRARPSWSAPRRQRFYSQSCETYSATSSACSSASSGGSGAFLFAVVRDVQRSLHISGATIKPMTFLFAVVRDVQRSLHLGGATIKLMTFLFTAVRDVQRNSPAQGCYTRTGGSQVFLFAVVRDVQRNDFHGQGLRGQVASIRCRAGRTAQLANYMRGHLHLRADSIRCRARRTAQPSLSSRSGRRVGCGLYSPSCETYSATGRRSSLASCRGGFYSLSCETYSATPARVRAGPGGHPVSIRCCARRTAQRDAHGPAQPSHCWVSIRCRASRTAQHDLAPQTLTPQQRFLFAVVRGVQRNTTTFFFLTGVPNVSIRCRARRTAQRPAKAGLDP